MKKHLLIPHQRFCNILKRRNPFRPSSSLRASQSTGNVAIGTAFYISVPPSFFYSCFLCIEAVKIWEGQFLLLDICSVLQPVLTFRLLSTVFLGKL